MARLRHLTRRSFLAAVAGGALLGTAASARHHRAPVRRQRMEVDADPRDPAREIPPPRLWAPAERARTGSTDSDAGPNADAAGAGRYGRLAAPTGRFVICPGSRRCPPRR